MTKQKKRHKIVYISGTWDLFHIGHLNIIREAWKQGDRVIVGINTDEYAKELKGQVVLNWKERKDLILQLRLASLVISHKSGDDIRVFKYLNADCRVVGSGWGKTKGQKKALKEMKKLGIKVVRYPRTPGISTSIIKERIRSESIC